MSKIRYKAMWVDRQHCDAGGEWDPERDEYAANFHATEKEARIAAIARSKQADQTEWWQVAEQYLVRGCWVTMREWTGDWSGFSELTYQNTVDADEVYGR